jgi:uncharacterized Zn finger protein
VQLKQAMKLTHRHIQHAVGAPGYQRGLEYHASGKVLELDTLEGPHGVRLDASTSGSGGAVYEQRIALTFHDQDVEIDGQCTCPMLYNCKHVAAVCCAWYARQHPRPHTPGAPSAMLNWLA